MLVTRMLSSRRFLQALVLLLLGANIAQYSRCTFGDSRDADDAAATGTGQSRVSRDVDKLQKCGSHMCRSSPMDTLYWGRARDRTTAFPVFVHQGMHDSRWSMAREHRVAMFASNELAESETAFTIAALLDVFERFMKQHGLEWWLTHGSLLGQTRDQMMVPWDKDCDVGVTDETLQRMVELLKDGADFGPSAEAVVAVHRSGQDSDCLPVKLINSTNGLYVDVMVFYRDSASTSLTSTCTLHRGDNARRVAHHHGEIFPLLECTFLGERRWCPHQPERYLLRWYASLEVPTEKLIGE